MTRDPSQNVGDQRPTPAVVVTRLELDVRFGVREDGVGLMSLDEVRSEALRCVRCTSRSKPSHVPLVEGRKQVVFGVGLAEADLMFIGEAPGEAEDETGEPFAGKGPQQAGSILEERLRQAEIRRTDVYITNVVLCRPTEIKNGHPPSNRAPSEEEVTACASWLDEQVIRVNPRLVVPLGVLAARRVLGREVTMVEVHGKVLKGGDGGVWRDRLVVATYHPTGIRGDHQRKTAFEEDFKKIREVLETIRRTQPSDDSAPGRS